MPYIQTHDRTSLFYTDSGAGRPMVFVASAWLDSRMWEFQIPYLVDHGFRCIEGTGVPIRHGAVSTTTRSPMIWAHYSTTWISTTSRLCRTRLARGRSCGT
jgi:hypothetical protein